MKRFPSIKKNSDFQKWKVLCKPSACYVCNEKRGRVKPAWYIREQKGRQQRGTSPYCQTDAGDIPAE